MVCPVAARVSTSGSCGLSPYGSSVGVSCTSVKSALMPGPARVGEGACQTVELPALQYPRAVPAGEVDGSARGHQARRALLREAVQVADPRHRVGECREGRHDGGEQSACLGVVGVGAGRGEVHHEPGLGPGGTGSLYGGLSTDNWTAYAELVADGELDARVSVLLLPAPMGGSADDLRKGLAELSRPEAADPRLLSAIGVKIFGDGVPPNRTAWQDFADDWKGTIESGKAADLCVLDRPLLDLDPHEITQVQVDLTVFDGRVVFERRATGTV
ncbi:amidohydrolase family protein [Streptomyces sp. NPDC001795]|uniref:amidohydrolase family protein n=1 Tax=unclassified Streptomyces TaxID=2593676 RepID=UPI0033251E15